jgi:hypothetical protein
MIRPVEFEISITVKVREDGTITPVTRILVNGEQIEFVNRLRVDVDSDESLPAVEIDMLRGHSMDLVSPSV